MGNRPIIQKHPRYENRKLLDLCHRAPCVLNFPGCTGGTDDEFPSVPCHSNWQEDGKGVGLKAHDHTAIPGCPHCHWTLDFGPQFTKEQKQEVFRLGQRRWDAYRWEHGLIKVA